MTTTGTAAVAALPVNPSPAELRAVLSRQRELHIAEGIPDAETRLDRIDRFVAGVLEAAEELSAALDADFGSRPRLANLASDIVGALGPVKAVREHLADWMQDEQILGPGSGTPTFVQVRPKGVVGIIGPWNFPVGLVVHPTIDALAAGNRVMIKFSDIPERTAEVFAQAVAGRMDPSEVAVVRGGLDTARAFSALPFDHILFTGSPAVGAQVAEAAGRNLVPVTLELGGKNPVVISPGAEIGLAAERIAGFRLMNGGQICLCPDYVFVPRSLEAAFTDAYAGAIRRLYPTYLDNSGVISIINDRNFDRVTGLIEEATEKGARVRTIAPEAETGRLPDRASRRIAPTMLFDVTADMRIESEEIFGPVVVIYPYDDLSEAIGHVNQRPSPLAAYWFGPDDPAYRQFLAQTTSGGVTRNDLGLHWSIEGAPSGGIGMSGMGAYTGRTGFSTFSHFRTVTASELPTSMYSLVSPAAGQEAADAIAAAIGAGRDVIEQRLARPANP